MFENQNNMLLDVVVKAGYPGLTSCQFRAKALEFYMMFVVDFFSFLTDRWLLIKNQRPSVFLCWD